MTQERWSAVEEYLVDAVIGRDSILDRALATSAEARLPLISVTPAEGKFLQLLARSIGAQRILEIGTLGGYSTIWLARALPPSGRLVTLEIDPRHAEVARGNIEFAGLSGLVEIRGGNARDALPRLLAEGAGPFDLTFIDADKPGNPEYFQWALQLSRPGSVIIVDNVIREGAVIDAASGDANVQGVRRMNALIAAEPRVSATAIQTVGSKGYDGFLMALVLG